VWPIQAARRLVRLSQKDKPPLPHDGNYPAPFVSRTTGPSQSDPSRRFADLDIVFGQAEKWKASTKLPGSTTLLSVGAAELFSFPWPGPGNSEGPVNPDGWMESGAPETPPGIGTESETPLLSTSPWPGPGDSEA
jgi:hypothetical protein